MKRELIILIGFLLTTVNAGLAEVPKVINYQARLTDVSGNPIPDGVPSVTFRLYESATATQGEAKWVDTFDVHTKNGFFNVLLGSGSVPFPGNLDFSKQYWVGIKVGSDDEMTERLPLATVPYAMRAEYANQLSPSAIIFPIGSIIAWHKNFPGVPTTLPWGFVECNGQTINDSESPCNGATLPNLNSASSTGYFLRGSNHSGDLQQDAFQGHLHQQVAWDGSSGSIYVPNQAQHGGVSATGYYTLGPSSDGANGAPRIGNETRPKNISVIWIMKVK